MAARISKKSIQRNFEPYILNVGKEAQPSRLKVKNVENPLPNITLGDIGLAIKVEGPKEFQQSILVQPYSLEKAEGIDQDTIRVFRYNKEADSLRPVWNSGVNNSFCLIWCKINAPGIYVPIGLPRDKLLYNELSVISRERRYLANNSDEHMISYTLDMLKLFFDTPDEELYELREFITRLEVQTGLELSFKGELRLREGGHLLPFPLPKNNSINEFRERVRNLKMHSNGLPEEQLFYPPEILVTDEPPWPLASSIPWNGLADWREIDRLKIWQSFDISISIPWLFSSNWWMYQHDVRHTGSASGFSNIRSTSVSRMYLSRVVAVDGPVITKPSIVDGKVYIGSGKLGGSGGTLYKIDLLTGAIENSFATSGLHFYPFGGIGGSPAVTNNRIYFTGVHGKLYCLDSSSFGLIWATDLKNPDPAHKQPVNNVNSDSWSGPLVVKNKVYVGCGEGESAPTYGFIFCLDANTGDVIWCFCTCKFTAGAHNEPNHIPAATAISNPLPAWATAAGFVIQSNPPETGCSVWSSCAYDYVYNRIYVGTGNSQYPHTAQPDEQYGSGLISLDADTGQFRAFFQPTTYDSYWPGDSDIDVPGSPTVYNLGFKRVVAFGSKNGSFFVLDANALVPVARRQLLPRLGGTGIPGNLGTGIDSVVPTSTDGAGNHVGENMYGIMATPAIHRGLGRIFIGIGGYNGMALDTGAGIDQTRTPFLRAVNWNNLLDAWPTMTGPDGIIRYTTTKPPMYTSREVGLSSPAVVNDVVFVSTDKTGLYALDANTGFCLWSGSGLPLHEFALGPAIYGNYVVMGAGNNIYIYTLRPRIWIRPDLPRTKIPNLIGPLPPVDLENPPGPWPGPPPILERPTKPQKI